jgi:type VI protein secretion system component VasK
LSKDGLRAVCDVPRAALNRKWDHLVVQPFLGTLAGKYPLGPGGQDAALADFKEFFRPRGTFWGFYENELTEYLAEDGTPVSAKGQEIASPELQACFRKAYEIRQAFFSGPGDDPSLTFSVRTSQPEQQGPPVTIYSLHLDLGGQSADYQMGQASWKPLGWPGADPTARAEVRALTSGVAVERRQSEGVWGFFRLLEQGSYSHSASGNPQVTWHLKAGPTTIRVTYEFLPSSAHHPFGSEPLRFELPGQL